MTPFLAARSEFRIQFTPIIHGWETWHTGQFVGEGSDRKGGGTCTSVSVLVSVIEGPGRGGGMTTNLEKKWVWLRPTFGFGMIGVIIGFSAFNVNLDVAMFRSQRKLMKEKTVKSNYRILRIPKICSHNFTGETFKVLQSTNLISNSGVLGNCSP